MSTTYTSQEVARILKVSETELRACLRAALFPAQRGPRRFTFQDLLLLQTAKRLCDAKIPMPRIRRLLQSLKRQLPDAESLSNLKIYADGRRVVVWDGQARWQPDSGQFLFNFEPVAPEREPVRLIRAATKRSVESPTPTAEQWIVRAMELEAESPDEAKWACLEALRLQPDLVDAHIQLGLLHHREGQLSKGGGICPRRGVRPL